LLINLNVPVKIQDKIIEVFKYNKANYRDLENRLNRLDLVAKSENKTAEETWKDIITVLQNFRANHIPKVIRNVNKGLPWFNNKIKRLIKRRNNLFKRFKKTGIYYFRLKYNVTRNLVTKQIRAAKAKYETKIIKRSTNNRKIFYSFVATKNRKGCSKKVGPLVIVRKEDGKNEVIEKENEISTVMNEYFASVFNKRLDEDAASFSKNSSQENILDKIIITEKEVLHMIGEFKPNKSPGVDNIGSTYALKIKEIISKPLTYLFTRSIANNEIPCDWKKANITPIFKKGERSNVENYRPVSLTTLFGKTLEKIIKNHIDLFLRATNYFNTSQHGFTKGRSCMSNLLVYQNSVVTMMDEG